MALLPREFWYELVDGELALRPDTYVEEQMRAEMAMLLERQSPADLTARYTFYCRSYWTNRHSEPYPDVAVTRREHAEPNLRALEHVLLAVDVLKLGRGFVETMDKVGWYASVGVPHLWIIEPGPHGDVGLTRYRLGSHGRYDEVDSSTAVIDVQAPFPVFFPLSELGSEHCRT